MKILITGATGLIGKEIVNQCLSKGYKIHYLTTRKSRIENEANYKGFYWNPELSEIDETCFEGVNVIINLAGASISKRWTKPYKKEVLDSRIKSIQLLRKTIKEHNIKINHLISASAIGIYPSSLDHMYTEDEPSMSSSFLGKVVKEWEKEINLCSELNIKIATIRIGLVLDKKLGAFPKILSPIKYGAGATFGNGKQWQSWIHVSDLAKIFLHVLDMKLEGVYNGVAPNPITNLEMTKLISKHLKRPLILPGIPKFVMKSILGEMHILVYESQKVSSEKNQNKGFDFQYNTFQKALEELI